jgi:hypothetical protein
MDIIAPIHLTRQELYAKVWTIPVRHLAQEFGLSDVGLAKLCKRRNIPTPPLGYWAKKAHGKPVSKPRLPSDPDESPIIIGARNESPAPPISLAETFFDPELGKLAEAETRAEHLIQVSETLRSPHRLVALTRDRLKGVKPSKWSRYGPTLSPKHDKEFPCLSVAVGKNNMGRALRILDAIVKGCELRGFQFVRRETRSNRTLYLEAFGIHYQLRVREPANRKLRALTNEDKERLKQYAHAHVERYEYVLSGKLQVELQNEWGYSSICTIRDGEKVRIEECLNRLVLAILREADERRRVEKKWAEEAKVRAIQQKIEEEEAE